MFIQPHDPDFVPEPIYPEYIPLEDEHILSAEEQPLPPIVSPTAESPGYVAESDPEEYEDDETKDGPVDYPMDGGDDDDCDSSGDHADNEDEEDEDEEEEEKEEEHLAPADSAVVIPTDELVFPPEGTEPITPPPFTDTDSQRVDLLMKDKIAHQGTIQIIEDEAYVVREAWAYSIGLSQGVHYELQTHQAGVCTRVSALDTPDTTTVAEYSHSDTTLVT
nr:hypothetical protein [Tanacetum cinerariifolium]